MDLHPGIFFGTLCFLIRGSRKNREVCLAKKKRKIGKGFLNGYGGGIEPGESSIKAIARELLAEAHIGGMSCHFKPVAKICFHNSLPHGGLCDCHVDVYLLATWAGGEPEETEEMGKPRWYKTHALPLKKMLPADREFLPRLLRGEKLIGEVFYGLNQQSLIQPSHYRRTREL